MDWIDWLKILLPFFLTLIVTVIGIMLKRLYSAIDLLFSKLDRQAKELHQMQLAITSIDPSKANMFRAFMLKPTDE